MNEPYPNIKNLISDLSNAIGAIENEDEKMDILNYARKMLHEVSPMRNHPVDFVEWVHSDNVEGNEYNPNSVAPPEMKLLITSIEEDGYTMPIVTNPEPGFIKIVDGFHRRQSEKRSAKISESTMNRLPVTYIREEKRDLSSRMASTIRHNRARGSHDIDLMSNIVAELISMGKKDEWIIKHLGMSADEVLRLKQFTGIANIFANEEFSNSWEIE